MKRLAIALVITACSATASLAGEYGYGYDSGPYVTSVYESGPYTTSVYVTEDYPWFGYGPYYGAGYSGYRRPHYSYGYRRPYYGYGRYYGYRRPYYGYRRYYGYRPYRRHYGYRRHW